MSVRRRKVKERLDREAAHEKAMRSWSQSLIDRMEHTINQIPDARAKAPESEHTAIDAHTEKLKAMLEDERQRT